MRNNRCPKNLTPCCRDSCRSTARCDGPGTARRSRHHRTGLVALPGRGLIGGLSMLTFYFSGTLQLAVGSWIALIGFFVGGVATAMLLFYV